MLYSEFLRGTNAPECAETYEAYKKIEAIYNGSDLMTKEEAYAIYSGFINYFGECFVLFDTVYADDLDGVIRRFREKYPHTFSRFEVDKAIRKAVTEERPVESADYRLEAEVDPFNGGVSVMFTVKEFESLKG